MSPSEVSADGLGRYLAGSVQVSYEHFFKGGGLTRKAYIAYVIMGGGGSRGKMII